MLQGTEITIYDWCDVEKRLIEIMGKTIEEDNGKIWSFWGDDQEVINETITSYCFDFDEYNENKFKREKQEELYNALKVLHEELGKPDSILIRYSW